MSVSNVLVLFQCCKVTKYIYLSTVLKGTMDSVSWFTGRTLKNESVQLERETPCRCVSCSSPVPALPRQSGTVEHWNRDVPANEMQDRQSSHRVQSLCSDTCNGPSISFLSCQLWCAFEFWEHAGETQRERDRGRDRHTHTHTHTHRACLQTFFFSFFYNSALSIVPLINFVHFGPFPKVSRPALEVFHWACTPKPLLRLPPATMVSPNPTEPTTSPPRTGPRGTS